MIISEVEPKGMMRKFALKPFLPAPITKTRAVETRRHQGIPGVEILHGGRLFAVWYGGELDGEGPGNYVVLATSADGGRSWREIQTVAPDDPACERAFDPVLWLDPLGRLWWIWNQCVSRKRGDIFDGRNGVWASICDSPDTDAPVWGEPRRISEGIMMNKPTVLADGAWVFPVAFWTVFPDRMLPEYIGISNSNLLITGDEGRSFRLITGPDVPGRGYDEHMMVELRNGAWQVYVRASYGIGQGFSDDGGETWRDIGDSGLGGPNSRFAVRRLKSGRLLLVNHQEPHYLPSEKRPPGRLREKLTAWLSGDDGKSWYGRLLLDGRPRVSYPDVTEGEDGFIYCIYDRERASRGEVLLARFTETDVESGTFVTPGSCSGGIVSAFPVGK